MLRVIALLGPTEIYRERGRGAERKNWQGAGLQRIWTHRRQDKEEKPILLDLGGNRRQEVVIHVCECFFRQTLKFVKEGCSVHV